MKDLKEMQKKLVSASPEECARLVKKIVKKKLYTKEKNL